MGQRAAIGVLQVEIPGLAHDQYTSRMARPVLDKFLEKPHSSVMENIAFREYPGIKSHFSPHSTAGSDMVISDSIEEDGPLRPAAEINPEWEQLVNQATLVKKAGK